TPFRSQPALERQEQGSVIGASRVVELADRSVKLPLLRVLQDQGPPLVGIAGRGTRSKYRWVELGRAPQVSRVVAEVTRRREPVAELALHADVPLLQRCRLQVQGRVHVDAERRKRLRRPSGVQRR